MSLVHAIKLEGAIPLLVPTDDVSRLKRQIEFHVARNNATHQAPKLRLYQIPDFILKVDDQVIPASAITFEVNGKSFLLDDLKAHPEEWWFVLDSAYLHVSGTKLQPGTEHEVSATIGIKPPYIPGFFRLTECNKRLAVK